MSDMPATGESAKKETYENLQLDISRYQRAVAVPSFRRQVVAMAKCRLLEFVGNSQEVFLSMTPCYMALINIICIITLMKYIPNAVDTILLSVMPMLIQISMILNTRLYIGMPVTHRQDKLRYLLKFAGVRSSSYFIGLFIGDCIIWCFPSFLLILCTYIVQVE